MSDWNPINVDLTRPNAARMYDWYLGGGHNFDVDREFGRQVEAIWPDIKPVARHNRAFLQRAVRESLDAGVRQFLDVGSGVPTAGNVHEIAFAHDPDARVVYVDYEPVAFTAGQLLLDQQNVTDRAAIIQHDLRRPDRIFDHPDTLRLLDLSKPVCLLMVAVLHFVGDQDRPARLLARYRERLAPGSLLALSHIAADAAPTEQAERVRRFCDAYQGTSNPLYLRDRDQVTRFFDGWSVLDPGVVFLPDWRPDRPNPARDPARTLAWCGMGELRLA